MHRELPEPGDFKEKYHIPDDKKIILCISRIDYQKNQKILLTIINSDPDSHLLLIGPVTAQWYLDELLSEAEKLGVKDRLTFIPGLPPDSIELLQALRTAYCFALPSRHEPFGIAALEALDAGVPLIASKVGGLQDFLVDGSNSLLFEDNNPAALLASYGKLADCRAGIIEGGKKTAAAYNWQNIAARLSDIYRRMIK